MNDQIAYELLEWIVDNMQTESIFLTPIPSTTVGVVELLDKIAELRGISKEENGRQFNNVIEANGVI